MVITNSSIRVIRIDRLTLSSFAETTGHTLAATLGFLGIYQEEQDVVYEQIVSVIEDGRDPVRYFIILTGGAL